MTDSEGQQFGNYRLTRLVGEGAFSQVYRGEHIYLGTEAAIKLLRMDMRGEGVEWFRTEARIIARLVHPRIVRILDFGIEGTTPYLVMDYAPNGTLRQRYPSGTRIPLPTIVSYVNDIADALQYAHDERFIHRDVKPENLLLGKRNEILLGDFGIALMTLGTQDVRVQNLAGTIFYIAPEQIEGRPYPASDQYALGVVIYEWLCGMRLFSGSFTDVLTQHLTALPQPLRQRVPTLSPEIEQVVMRALEKDPQKRFPRIQEFALALEQASQLAPRTASSQEMKQPAVQQQESKTGKKQVSSSPASVAPLLCTYRGHLATVRSLSWSPNGMRIVSVGDEKKVHLWDASTGSALTQFLDATETVRVIAWSPDGSYIASVGSDAQVRVWSVTTNQLVVAYRGHVGTTVNALAWSPIQQHIASAGDDGLVQIWEAKTGQPIIIYRAHTTAVNALAWSPDGTQLVSGDEAGRVHQWESTRASTSVIYQGQVARVSSVAWSPNGKRIAAGRADGTLQIWEVSTSTQVISYRVTSPIQVVAWSPDGKRFAFTGDDTTVQVWDTIINRRLLTIRYDAIVYALAWSPQGTSIAVGGSSTQVQIWSIPQAIPF